MLNLQLPIGSVAEVSLPLRVAGSGDLRAVELARLGGSEHAGGSASAVALPAGNGSSTTKLARHVFQLPNGRHTVRAKYSDVHYSAS